MPKVSKVQIDKDEKKILAELQKNSNESIDTLAKRCGFSRQKVWRSIKGLEQKKLIWGYTAILDEMKNDARHYTLLIKRTPQQLMEKTINIITSRRLEEIILEIGVTIESSYYTHGDYDWILTFTAQNIIQAKKFCESVLNLHPGVIDKTVLLETLFMVKDHHILNPDPSKLKEFVSL
jgi:Lrp/AsnC family transcriptional regulator, leucine-responsive regulatory protein